MKKEYWIKWAKATGVRTVKTMAETFTAMVSVAVVISDVDWKYVASATVLSGILTVATCIKGLPEVEVE
ncbi:MAG: hypothetical protein E7290_12580 [Lachnospiraceae bacterium]|nr:hypothetical protein [Lachnospiraceae bacterium]